MEEARTTAGRAPYGLLRLGEVTLALPLAQLLEVIPHPGRLMPLAIASPTCGGAVEVRGSAIPVVDLSARLALGDGTAARAIVAIVSWEGRVFGIAVDAAVGVVDVVLDDRRVLHGPSPFVTHTYRVDDDRTVLMLDVPAVVADGGTITTDDRLRSALAGTRREPGDAAGERRSLLLFQCGEHQLAIDTDDVHAVAPRVQPTPSPIRWPACRGTARHLGTDVPLVDPLVMTMLGRLDDDQMNDGIVMRNADGDVILLATRVIDIASVPAQARRARPPVGLPDPSWFSGFVDVADRGQFLLLDPERLRDDAALQRLCRLNVDAATRDSVPGERESGAPTPGASAGARTTRPGVDGTSGEDAEDGTALAGRSYLCFAVGDGPAVEAAALLEQVDEVVAVPSTTVWIDDGRGVVGLVDHRGRTLPLVCVATRLGLTAPTRHDRLVALVVTDGDRRAGLLVRELRTIATTVWEQATALPGRPRQLRFEPGAGLVRDVDLRALWHELVESDAEFASMQRDLAATSR